MPITGRRASTMRVERPAKDTLTAIELDVGDELGYTWLGPYDGAFVHGGQTGDVAQLERSYDQLREKPPDQWIEESTGLIRKNSGSNGCSQTDCDIVDWPASERDDFVFRPYNTVINAIGYRSFMDSVPHP
jgi:hypothetical protein